MKIKLITTSQQTKEILKQNYKQFLGEKDTCKLEHIFNK
jgi:hypothetical protein